jgi:TolA-binding protein
MITNIEYRAVYNVDLGYIYKKKGNSKQSEKQYNKALEKVKSYPTLAYSTSNQFQIYLETRWALRTFQVAEKYNPKLNFAIQKANLYGELGIVDSMLYGYFEVIEKQPDRKSSVQRYLSNFLKQNSSPEMGEKVKTTLLIKSQETTNPVFTELLLWYFTEKKEYNSAFTQAKSLYKRNYTGLNLIQQLGENALVEKQISAAEKCFNYIREEDINGINYFLATQSLLELQDKKFKNKMSLKEIEDEYKLALNKTVLSNEHFDLILSYSRFVAFQKGKTNEALEILENYTKPYNNYDNIMARKFLLEGDIYLLQQEFTKSFLAYQKAETWTSENIISDEAKFKSIKVAYYKGDFKWAMAQSKVLKKSVSKWYANNAAELFVTLQTCYSSDSSDVALKLYVKADLLKMQAKTDSAYTYYNLLIKSFPNHYLVPSSMFYQSEILIKSMAYNSAVETLKTLYQNYPNNNLSPIVLLRLSEVYLQKLKNKEEAEIWLKELMVKFPDDPLAQQARAMYRNNI